MDEVVTQKAILKLVLRGAVGGALGGLIWVTIALLISIQFSPVWLSWLVGGYLTVGLPAGAVLGGLIGSIIWLVNRLTRTNLGIIWRLFTGTLVATIISWAASWSLTQPGDYVVTPWHVDFVWLFFFGVAIGGTAGIMAGGRSKKQQLLQVVQKMGLSRL